MGFILSLSDTMYINKEHISLLEHSTFRTVADARYFIECYDKEGIKDIITQLKNKELPLFILGEGSNILFTEDFKGYILHSKIKGIEITAEDNTSVYMKQAIPVLKKNLKNIVTLIFPM